MRNTPDNKRAKLHGDESSDERNPPTPSEFIEATLYWLRHWWDAPREKSKAADWVMIALTIGIAGAAFWSAWVFQEQLRVARQTLEVDQRSWVKAEVDPKYLNDIESLPIKITNAGKTPARQIVAQTGYEIVPADSEGDLERFDLNATTPPLFPGDHWDLVAAKINADGSLRKISDLESFSALVDGSHYFAVKARISYVDGFGRHWTQFCEWSAYHHPRRYQSKGCVDYNDVDNEGDKTTD